MAEYISKGLRRLVEERAEFRCEYCRIPPTKPNLKHEFEHILPRQQDGQTIAANLAWACLRCNRRKGTNVGAFDSETGNLTRLYNPRKDIWTERFQVLEGGEIKTLTAEARVTVKILRINDSQRIEERKELMEAGIY